jgi:hypothetical protein
MLKTEISIASITSSKTERMADIGRNAPPSTGGGREMCWF